jgi:hypothetical protein
MKHVFLTMFFLLTVLINFAQFQKGNKVLGFGFGLSTTMGEAENLQFRETTTTKEINGSLELGFAIKENRLSGFFLGGGFGESKFESENPSSIDSKNTSYNYSAGYFTRMYKSLGKGFYVFGDVRGGYQYNYSKNSSTVDNWQQTHSITGSFFPGVTYKWTNRFLFEIRTGDFISVGYSKRTSKNGFTNERFGSNSLYINSSLGLGFLQNFGIGARWIIGQKA